MPKRFVKGSVKLEESSEYRMGYIEAETYGKPCHRAGLSAAEAEAATIERGLYPFWLLGSELESKLDKGAHEAWMKGIQASIKAIYRKPLPDAKTEVSFVKNEKAEGRAKEIAASTKPSSRARKEAIEALRATTKAPEKKLETKDPAESPAQGAKSDQKARSNTQQKAS